MSRLRTRSDTSAFLQKQEEIILNPEEKRGEWHRIFANNHPIYLELGMGKGQFIAHLSQAFPNVNFIGIDLYDELVRKAYEKSAELREEHPFSNLRLVRMNIGKLEQAFAAGEVARVYLNFSDPWPKKRHANRRLTHPDFLNKYIGIMQPGGQIHLRTDSESLFEFSLNSFADMGLRMKNIRLNLHKDGSPEGHIFTEYEQKFVEKGMPIYQCEVHI